MSNMDMVLDLLRQARKPLPISEILSQNKSQHKVSLDRESTASKTSFIRSNDIVSFSSSPQKNNPQNTFLIPPPPHPLSPPQSEGEQGIKGLDRKAL